MQVGCARCGHVLEFSTAPPRFCSNCGQSLTPAATVAAPTVAAPATPHGDPAATAPFTARPGTTDRAPEKVGGYRLLRPLGTGGMGTVFEAEDATGRRVALKLIRPEFADSRDAVERFRREGKLAGTITHPRCVFVFAAEEDTGRPYIVMELMPGSTLHDLVDQRGPLPVAEAVAFVLDVIDGLQEAHRCGVLHRDVKPNNCFLDRDGRVKVGDFGLARALVPTGQLTRSGAFLGTVLFAAPEQVRNDQVDQLADVYSVSATLYFLLTGRAPFEADDPATALARALTDPLTPMRALRPELPRTLDEVVRRGLARSRSRRWQSLEELRLALLPFVPGPHTLGEVGWRCGAYVCDLLLLLPVELVGRQMLFAAVRPSGLTAEATVYLLSSLVVGLVCGLLYFAVPEALWGCSLGKYLTRLRVRTAANDDRPRLARSCLRTLVFCAAVESGPLLLGLLLVGVVLRPVGSQPELTLAVISAFVIVVLPPWLAGLAGVALIAVTMRRRNGYRGLHDLASGTKVIRLPSARALRGLGGQDRLGAGLTRPKEMPARVGTFAVTGALRWAPDDRLLLGADELLGRPVWLWLRSLERTPLPPGRAELGRGTRPRWLGGGVEGQWRWDAFVASPGCLLSDLGPTPKPLPWPDALHLLEQLTAELVAAAGDGTLPPSLGPEQVWLQPTGRAQLLDVPLYDAPPPAGLVSGEAGARHLLQQAAAIVLEGRPRSAEDAGRPIRAPLPGHAARLLHQLMSGDGTFRSLQQFQAGLQSAREQPVEVTRPRRGVYLALSALALGPGLAWMLSVGPLLIALGTLMSAMAGAFQGEHADRELTARIEQSCVSLVTAPGPLERLAFAVELKADLAARDELRSALLQEPRTRTALLQSSSSFHRESLARMEQRERGPEAQDRARREEMWEGANARERALIAGKLLRLPVVTAEEMLANPFLTVGAIALWPFVWALWSGLTRGGLGLRLAGVRLVQGDGRPAARWRCAWRSVVLWSPLVVLLLVSLYLDLWRIADTGPDWPSGVGSLAWLAWLTWWLAVALLPLYAGVAMRWPNRGPHDALAGTYLVPR
jgi:hypothetical protein